MFKCDVWTHIFCYVQHCIFITLIGLAMKVELEFVEGGGMYSVCVHACMGVCVCMCMRACVWVRFDAFDIVTSLYVCCA